MIGPLLALLSTAPGVPVAAVPAGLERPPIVAVPGAAAMPRYVRPATRVWSALGHRLISRIATARLSAPARAELARLLPGLELTDVAVWADSIRPSRRETGPLHYINIPIDSSFAEWRRFCPAEGCVLEALDRYLGVLADRSRPDLERAEAVKWIVHLVGDLHQPLHVGERGDRGGNDVRVRWGDQQTNLHWIWDGAILQTAGLDENAYWDRLWPMARRADSAWSGGRPADWAAESHALSRAHVYALPADSQLSGPYARENLPRAEVRLVKAGLRLARLLEETLAAR